jgi:hypothetical protein
MTFRVGQKVVCVDADFSMYGGKAPPNLPVEGGTYTLRGSVTNGLCIWWRLGEISNPTRDTELGIMEPAFAARRFRPVVERKTDISIFKKMLRPVSKELCGND